MKTRAILLLLALLSLPLPVQGQQTEASAGSTVERRFTLDIRDTVITRDDLFAGTALVVAPTAEQLVSVYIGASVSAREADIRL